MNYELNFELPFHFDTLTYYYAVAGLVGVGFILLLLIKIKSWLDEREDEEYSVPYSPAKQHKRPSPSTPPSSSQPNSPGGNKVSIPRAQTENLPVEVVGYLNAGYTFVSGVPLHTLFTAQEFENLSFDTRRFINNLALDFVIYMRGSVSPVAVMCYKNRFNTAFVHKFLASLLRTKNVEYRVI